MKKTNQKAIKLLRIIPFMLIIVLAASLTACKSKEPVTANAFKETVEALEYTVVDITEQYAEYPHILKAFGCENRGVHVEFFEVDNNDNATALFNGNKSQVEAYKGNTSVESSVSTGSYQKYILKTSEKYYLVERVGATLVYAYSDKSESEKLDNIIKELGY